MSKPSGLEISPKLYVFANLTETLVVDYDIKQSDPLIAASSGVGNCLAKSVITAVMLERAKLVGPKPAIAWNKNTHPKYGNDMFGAPKILNGHAYLLIGNNDGTKIAGISFNPKSEVSSKYEIFDFNDEGDYAVANDRGSIEATDIGATVGYTIANWHLGSRLYMEALGSTDSVFHRLAETEMTKLIIDSLVERDVISAFTE
jgi:hypothetical protein